MKGKECVMLTGSLKNYTSNVEALTLFISTWAEFKIVITFKIIDPFSRYERTRQ